jgi:hypothetical protein
MWPDFISVKSWSQPKTKKSTFISQLHYHNQNAFLEIDTLTFLFAGTLLLQKQEEWKHKEKREREEIVSN